MISHEVWGVSNHRPRDYLSNNFLRQTWKQQKAPNYEKMPVTQQVFRSMESSLHLQSQWGHSFGPPYLTGAAFGSNVVCFMTSQGLESPMCGFCSSGCSVLWCMIYLFMIRIESVVCIYIYICTDLYLRKITVIRRKWGTNSIGRVGSTLRTRQNERHLADDILKLIFF